MIDAHAHLHDAAFAEDRDAVVARALAAGLEAIVTVGTDTTESELAVACALSYPAVWASVGLHPELFRGQLREEDIPLHISRLRALLETSSKIVAIGECGLDYFAHPGQAPISTVEQQVQHVGLVAQMELAKTFGLPLIIHTRPSAEHGDDAYEDLLSLFASLGWGDHDPLILLHCYMGSVGVTEKFLTLPNVFFSLAGNITYKAKTGSERDEALNLLPLERVLVETDSPYLAPVPYRGKRNEPAYVVNVARYIAEMKKISYTTVEAACRNNFQRLFPGIFL